MENLTGDLNFNGFPGKLMGICWDIIGICNGRVVTAWGNYFTTSSGINAIHGNTLSADQQKKHAWSWYLRIAMVHDHGHLPVIHIVHCG